MEEPDLLVKEIYSHLLPSVTIIGESSSTSSHSLLHTVTNRYEVEKIGRTLWFIFDSEQFHCTEEVCHDT